MPAFAISKLERKIIDRELKMRLYEVRFEDYERCIKRLGFRGTITDNILAEISQEIMLNLDELVDRNSLVNHYFRNDKLFDHGNYDTYGLLLLGFLLCRHTNTRTAAEILWTIVNPAINATVSRE